MKSLTFILGCIAGGAVGYLLAYKKATEEFNQRWEKEHSEDISKKPESMQLEKTEEVVEDTTVEVPQIEPITEAPTTSKINKAHIISEDEYGEYADYKEVVLHFFTDGIIADNNVREITVSDDIQTLIEAYFEDGDEDEIYIRDDNYKRDYNVLAMRQGYAEFCAARDEYRNRAVRYS